MTAARLWSEANAVLAQAKRAIAAVPECDRLIEIEAQARNLARDIKVGLLDFYQVGDALTEEAVALGMNMTQDDADKVQLAIERGLNGAALFQDPEADGPPPVESAADYGLPDDVAAARTDNMPAQAKQPRFVPVAIDDVQPAADPAWLIDRLLPARGLGTVVGPPKSRKSFFTTDLLFHVPRNAPYAGRQVMPGPVIYCTGEGVTGFKRRLVAMRRHYGVEGAGVPFFMIENVPDLGSAGTDLFTLLGDLDQFIQQTGLAAPRAIALDTLARCMGDGDENTAKDMGRFVNRCGMIERHYRCLVLVVHHMGKNPAAGGRGSNALNGAADVTMTVEKSETFSTVRIDEMKDGPEGQEWRFRLAPYHLSATSDTPPQPSPQPSTCVVELMSEPTVLQPSATKSKLPPRGVPGDLLKVIRRAISEAGEINLGSVNVPNNVRAVSRDNLKRYCATMDWQQDTEASTFRAMLSKYLSALRAADLIGFDKQWVWMP